MELMGKWAGRVRRKNGSDRDGAEVIMKSERKGLVKMNFIGNGTAPKRDRKRDRPKIELITKLVEKGAKT